METVISSDLILHTPDKQSGNVSFLHRKKGTNKDVTLAVFYVFTLKGFIFPLSIDSSVRARGILTHKGQS